MNSITTSVLSTMPNISNKNTKLHIAMLPWMAFGHMLPYLELAKLIASKGHRVSFISAPRNIDRLPPLPPSLSTLMTFVKIPLPHNPNLPEGSEATSDLTEEQVFHFKNTYDKLKEPIFIFLKSSKPDWILFDFAPYWIPEIAKPLGIRTAFCTIVLALVVAFLGPTSPEAGYVDDRELPEDFTVPPKWVSFPSEVKWRLFEVLRLFRQIAGDETSDVSTLQRFILGLKGCDAIAVRSCAEFESQWLSLLETIHGKPVFPMGVLSPKPKDDDDEDDDDDETWLEIKGWLDMQDKNSVVYVAFGSEAVPTQEEATEIAVGLEKSGFPFFWVMRTKHGEDGIKFPEGFELRNQKRGVVCRKWVPQLKILKHESFGVFLSHAGWSSVVEAMSFGRPMVLFPLSNDQGLNARYFGERKVGFEVVRDEESGEFTSEAVAEAVRMVVEKEEGRVYREKAEELRLVFGDRKKQDVYVDKLLEFLATHKG